MAREWSFSKWLDPDSLSKCADDRGLNGSREAFRWTPRYGMVLGGTRGSQRTLGLSAVVVGPGRCSAGHLVLSESKVGLEGLPGLAGPRLTFRRAYG